MATQQRVFWRLLYIDNQYTTAVKAHAVVLPFGNANLIIDISLLLFVISGHKTYSVFTRICALFFPLSTKDLWQAARYPWPSLRMPPTNDATVHFSFNFNFYNSNSQKQLVHVAEWSALSAAMCSRAWRAQWLRFAPQSGRVQRIV